MSINKTIMTGVLTVAIALGVGGCFNRAKAEPVTVIVGAAVALGVLGYIVGRHAGSSLDVPAMKYNDTNDAQARCASTYKSYEPATGLYSPAPGLKKICPFLQ